MALLMNTDFIKFGNKHSGKVRDIFDLGDCMLIVVSDRVSAFDVVFNEGIPNKGKVLNGISAFWFNKLSSLCPNHVLELDPEKYPDEFKQYSDELRGRSMLVKKAEMLPVECIVRGYLEGSALREYKSDKTVSGIRLPSGLRQGDKLPEIIFTPSTKENEGHDVNISFSQLETLIGKELACALKDMSIALYKSASEFAESKGIIIADSKFEFGLIDGKLTVCDELFTPDSSRFWEKDKWEPGKPQLSFDKQYLREYLSGIDWDKTYPAPRLPEEIIKATELKYKEAYRRLTGEEIQ